MLKGDETTNKIESKKTRRRCVWSEADFLVWWFAQFMGITLLFLAVNSSQQLECQLKIHTTELHPGPISRVHMRAGLLLILVTRLICYAQWRISA